MVTKSVLGVSTALIWCGKSAKVARGWMHRNSCPIVGREIGLAIRIGPHASPFWNRVGDIIGLEE
jgi:hypothetical protein